MFSRILGDALNRGDVRAALLTRWFFNAASVLTGLFLQIMIYEQFKSIETNVFFYVVQHTALMCALCGVGWNAHRWGLTTRHMMQISAVVLSMSFISFFIPQSFLSVLSFIVFYGVGQGLYWLSNNVYELTIMSDSERDAYASALVAGRKVIAIASPFIATLCVAAASYFSFSEYTFVLALAALCFIACIWATYALVPFPFTQCSWATALQMMQSKYQIPFQFFTAATAVHECTGMIILPLVALFILGNAVSVGSFTTIASCIGLIGVYLTSFLRTTSSRVLYLWIGYGACVLGALALGMYMTLFALMVFMLIERTLVPLGAVSLHTLAVYSIERLSFSSETKYESMLLRDFFLWVWRVCGALFFLYITSFGVNTMHTLQMGMYAYALSVVLLLFAGVFLQRTRE